MSDGVFVRCEHRSDDAEKRRVVFKYANERYTTHTHRRDVCIYNLLRQNRFRRSTRLERFFCQYTRLTFYIPGQMVIILARVMGNYTVINAERVRTFLHGFFFVARIYFSRLRNQFLFYVPILYYTLVDIFTT